MREMRWWAPLVAVCLGLALVGPSADAVAIDNSVAAPPDVECLEDRIRVWVHTRKYFAGRIYAKNRAEYPACIQGGYAAQKTKKPHWEVTFGQCGMTSLRSIDPRGMFYSLTIVVSFHPLIITKVDQAFHVKCFFEEANRGLTAELGISMIPTTEVGAHHGIPGCTYSIHQGTIAEVDRGILGAPIQFARVGEKILHRWECADQMFGVLINKCYVTDGFGARAEVVDEKGCPLDPILITGIRYAANLTVAFAESHVFKFADKPGVWFFCQIQMCMKGGGMCYGVTPPQCSGNIVTTGQGYVPPSGPPPQGIDGSYGGGGAVQAPHGPLFSGPAPQPANFLPPPTGGQSAGGGGGYQGGGGYAAANEDPLEGNSVVEPIPIDLVFDSDDVVGAGMEGEANHPFETSGNLIDIGSPPDLGNSVMGEGKHEARPFPDDPVLLDSQDLKFLSKGERRLSDSRVESESLEETDGQRSPKFPKPRVVEPRRTGPKIRPQPVRPNIKEPFPEGFDENSFNETELIQDLSGGLIVYDVDEEAPMFLQRSKAATAGERAVETAAGEVAAPVPADCALGSRGLLVLVSVLCGLSGALGLVLWLTCLRLRRATAKGAPSGSTEALDPIASVADHYREHKAQKATRRSRSRQPSPSQTSGAAWDDWEDRRRPRHSSSSRPRPHHSRHH